MDGAECTLGATLFFRTWSIFATLAFGIFVLFGCIIPTQTLKHGDVFANDILIAACKTLTGDYLANCEQVLKLLNEEPKKAFDFLLVKIHDRAELLKIKGFSLDVEKIQSQK